LSCGTMTAWCCAGGAAAGEGADRHHRADAAVVVWEDVEPVRVILARLRAKGVRVIVIGPTQPSGKPTDASEDRLRSRGLPD
jgi:hypothetical protein